jgi:hypothetical protein
LDLYGRVFLRLLKLAELQRNALFFGPFLVHGVLNQLARLPLSSSRTLSLLGKQSMGHQLSAESIELLL